MLKINEIKMAFEKLILSVDGIIGLFFAVNEKNASVRMSKLKGGIYIGVVYPTIETLGGNDNGVQVHRLTVLVLSRQQGQADTADTEFDRYQQTQKVLDSVLLSLCESSATGFGVFSRLKLNETLIEPIYNLNGFDGWGMDMYI